MLGDICGVAIVATSACRSRGAVFDFRFHVVMYSLVGGKGDGRVQGGVRSTVQMFEGPLAAAPSYFDLETSVRLRRDHARTARSLDGRKSTCCAIRNSAEQTLQTVANGQVGVSALLLEQDSLLTVFLQC